MAGIGVPWTDVLIAIAAFCALEVMRNNGVVVD
jgi:hypothetical protein